MTCTLLGINLSAIKFACGDVAQLSCSTMRRMILNSLGGFARSLGQLFFPAFCYACGRPEEANALQLNVCRECWENISPVGESICSRCGKPFSSSEPAKVSETFLCINCRDKTRFAYSRLRSPFRYRSPMREMIHLFKFQGMTGIGGALGKLLADWVAAGNPFPDADLIVPVPLHFWRFVRRGFNQSEILARATAEKLGLPYLPGAIRRVRNTTPQSRLNPVERRRNLKGAFFAETRLVRKKKVLIVDDVLTTGTTIRECAATLRRSGAAEIFALTLARAD